MKPIIPVVTLAFAAACCCSAQEDRVTIPARNPSRPPQVNISLLNGGVTVKAYNGKEVTVESQHDSRRDRERRPDPPEVNGMRRLEFPGNSGLEIEEENNVINIRTRSHNKELLVRVPIQSSLKIRCNSGGDILVDGVHGEVDAHNLNGRVTLTNITGTVIAHSLNGAVHVTMDRVDPAKPISFSTLNGEVDVTLPADLRANLKLKTDNGDIFSDFDVKLDPSRGRSNLERTNSADGRYVMRSDRTMYGTINGGGQEASFTTFNGRISIHKKK